jgi:serine O-acetyltransferase
MYQNVTLGGTNPTTGIGGKRHPTILDNVIIGSGAQILGPITVGERARIGAAAVVTDDVPAGATMIGQKARSTLVKAETYARDFMPYGTPCREMFDPATQSLEIMQCEIERLRKKVAELMAQRDASSNVTPAKPRPAKGRKVS